MDDEYEHNSVDELMLAGLAPEDLVLEQMSLRMSGGTVRFTNGGKKKEDQKSQFGLKRAWY